MQQPYGVHLISDGVLVTEVNGAKLSKYSLSPSDEPLWTFNVVQKPSGITTDEPGFIYVAGTRSLAINIISPEGNQMLLHRLFKQFTSVTVAYIITYFLHIRQEYYHCPLIEPPDLTQTE